MSQESIEIVRRSVAAWNLGDFDGFVSYFDPACEIIFRPEVPEPGPFRGRGELRQWLDGFQSAWESHQIELVEAEDAADRVFTRLRMIGQAAGSGIATDDTEIFVFTIRDGQIVRFQGFAESDDAREAAGL